MALDPLVYLSMLVLVLALALVIVVRAYHDKVTNLKERLRELDSSKRSLSTTYGLISEQWAPFMAEYPYDPRNFRFLGAPIDGVQFEDDKIVFVEFKTNTSRLSPRESRVRELVESGRVEWLEYRLVAREARAASPPAPPPTAPAASEDWGADREPGVW